MSDRFRCENELIRRKIRDVFSRRYSYLCDLKIEGWRTKEPVTFENRMTGEYISVNKGESWGERWDCAWFHITGEVPCEAAGKYIIAKIDFSGEGCLYSEEGVPLEGLNLARRHRPGEMLGDESKTDIKISESAQGGEKVDLWIDAGCNDLFGHYIDNGAFKTADIEILNYETNQLYYDFQILKSLMDNLPGDSARRQSIFYSLLKACYELKTFSEEEVLKARAILKKELDKKGGDPSLSFTALGHAHLDLAWLWPIRESKRKAAATFASALRNMERYPDYCFGQSQPQQFKWVKDEHPELYRQIKEKVKEGRLEPQGAMWVEADTNVSGGEALIRQLLYGKRFFKEEFDKDIKVLWLPDVFGYSGALPQILKKSGVEYFMTIKLSWSKINDFPYHTFKWVGIDGSEVLAHMPPEGTYGSWAEPRSVIFAEKNFREKGISDEALLLYGVCDGGGGPSEDHLESIKRIKNLSGVSPVHQEPAINFFERIDKHREDFPSWNGELYLEYHQGTYTTQARNKLFNRKMENSLREAEFALTAAFLQSGYEYPKERLDEIWQEVLLYQFHDILPGSSIKRVYDESVERYMKLHEEVCEITEKAYTHIAASLIKNSDNKDMAIFNSLSWTRKEWVNTATGWINVEIPPMGYSLISVSDGAKSRELSDFSKIKSENGVLENDKLSVKLNERGHIISLYDKVSRREAVAPGTEMNRLAVYNDPGDAWDFSLEYRNEELGEFMLESERYYTEGPDAVAELTFKYGNSCVKQTLRLRSGEDILAVECFADWQETEKMLRAELPLNIHSENVKCGIQFGNVTRPTHNNTSWDYAKYEICAQKWIDISNRGYGIAVLNDCKYGHGVLENNISLNLLRSPSHPGENSDKGYHVFSYAVYPHKGDYFEGEVDKRAYEFNIKPVMIQLDTSLPNKDSEIKNSKGYISVDSENSSVMIETVKKAEDGGDIIIRMYEYSGGETFGTLSLNIGKAPKRAWLTDLMENNISELEIEENRIKIPFGAFEIQTVKVEF